MSAASPPVGRDQSPSGVTASITTPKQSPTASPGDWREMHDPNTGKTYWVNHFTKQMSYHPPSRHTSPPTADAGGGSGLGKYLYASFSPGVTPQLP